jgi:hypothetical protein
MRGRDECTQPMANQGVKKGKQNVFECIDIFTVFSNNQNMKISVSRLPNNLFDTPLFLHFDLPYPVALQTRTAPTMCTARGCPSARV